MDAAQRRDLQQAMTRLADGDRSAFHPVFDIAWPVAQAFARSFLRGRADAEDAAQQALIRAFERASEFDRQRDALSWLLGIVAWECRTLRRRSVRRREEPLAAAPERDPGAASAEAELLAADLARAAFEVLGSLPSADVKVVVASLSDRFERPALISAAAFRKRLERARRRLRAAWRAKHGTC